MTIGFKDSKKKFHPISQSNGVRKSRDQKAKQKGIKVDSRKARQVLQLDMSEKERMEWERVVGSEVVKVKHEMMNGKPVTSVRFANGEEWFEFDKVSHQEEFMKKEKIEVNESVIEEFVEIDHPDISGYITMATGKVLFGEREDRMKRGRQRSPTVIKEEIEFMESEIKRINNDPSQFGLTEHNGILVMAEGRKEIKELEEELEEAEMREVEK